MAVTETTDPASPDVEAADVAPPASSSLPRWRALAAVVGEPTDDRRIFDSLTWRDPSTPPGVKLSWQRENLEGHEGSVQVGTILEIVQIGNEVWATGEFDIEGEYGHEAHRLVKGGFLQGVSIDASVLEFYDDEAGFRHYSGKMGGLTLVAFPAFDRTFIELLDVASAPIVERPVVTYDAGALSSTITDIPATLDEAIPAAPTVLDFERHVGLVASARPILSAAAFTRPDFTRREGCHIEDDGRVWGHIYGWGECHVGSPPGKCIQPTTSATGYAYFLTGSVLTDEGEVAVGQIAISTDHAPLDLGWTRARDHYANTGLVAADVTCGEDEYGIWVAGMVRPDCAPEVLHAFHASKKISGDWRPVGRGLELVAVLTVNVEGYPRLAARVENGQVLALVASAPMNGGDCGCGGTTGLEDVFARLEAVEAALSVYRAQAQAEQATIVAAMELDLGLDAASQITRMETDLGLTEVPA